MNKLETPQGRLLYMYWKLHRDKRISNEAKAMLKDMTILNDEKIAELVRLATTKNEQTLQDSILQLIENNLARQIAFQRESDEESQSIKSVRTMSRLTQLRPRIEIRTSNWKLMRQHEQTSMTPKLEPKQSRLSSVGSKLNGPALQQQFRYRATTTMAQEG